MASGKVISTDPLDTLPGTRSRGFADPTIGGGKVLLRLQHVQPVAATVAVSDPCHPKCSSLGQYK